MSLKHFLAFSLLTYIQQGEQEHKRPKRLYLRVSRAHPVIGIAKQVARERRMHLMRAHNDSLALNKQEESNALVPYVISREKRQKLDIYTWLGENKGDPALAVCSHILTLYSGHSLLSPSRNSS